ncbi:c-type cytochrome domain-containing protein [Algoriphagus limi]|uniref:Chitobiase/beta-hexosaminidase C-terminal domain-containing protein n=1 Tax=Algoriphagus limi TaxID=2975273 RepID=A0ABT2G3M9_9BACT|nr:c-type cytochrome domain-containing protein [Algoriphagus limi]MCS5489874.1 chitobiase/beta-hexosaminidase C-terminal domain-containing protein [Algoriphagus limi]
MTNPLSKLNSILENLLFVWLGLSFILLIGEKAISLPPILQVIGRGHPLLLHFPITLILIGVIFLLFPSLRNNETFRDIGAKSLLWGSNLAGITVIAGLILAREDYEGDSLLWHQWAGMVTFWGASFIYFFQKRNLKQIAIPAVALGICLTLTGHWGANITHGENYLLAPLNPPAEQVPLAEAEVFDHVIQPILQAKCESCHREGKTKGELRMDNLSELKKGGKSGPFVVSGDLTQSLLTQRINLPLEEEEHMPPKNKAQLTEEEFQILTTWVESGANFEGKLVDLPQESELFQLASLRFSSEDSYDFEPASGSTIEDLNTYFRKVSPIYPESPALEVSYFGISAFEPSSLKDLQKIKEQLVNLRLDKMPLSEVNLDFLNDFPNLRELSLNFTELTAGQLESFPLLDQLEGLSLSGNSLTPDAINRIAEMENLQNLFLWNTGLNDSQKQQLSEQLPNTKIDFGFEGKDIILPLNSPKITQDRVLFSDSLRIELSHPIQSTTIRFTLDGTEPDSISSPVYSEPIYVKTSGKIRAKAFAPEWIGSEEITSVFMKSGLKPQNVELLTQPSPNYKAQLAETLFDQIKGKNNHTSGEWLGYSDKAFEAEFSLEENQHPTNIGISLLYHEGAYIFPPVKVEIMGWRNGKAETLISDQPTQSEKIREIRSELLTYKLPDGNFEKIRVKLYPIQSLPKWHPGAGAKGWVFIDEILLN